MHRHNSTGHLCQCAIDLKTNLPTVYLQWICNIHMSTEPRHVISMGPRLPEIRGEASICSAS